MSPTGRLEAIWVKRVRRGPMDPVGRALLDDRGIQGNANRGGRRAITLIERETFERVRLPTLSAWARLGPAVDPAMRRANLMISGVRLAGTRGRVLTVGRTRIRIGGETRPCERMDEAHEGLRAALEPEWGGGAFGVVLEGGEIAVGDPVAWEQATLPLDAPPEG
jgi:MOSC domain-containing protein YiiM